MIDFRLADTYQLHLTSELDQTDEDILTYEVSDEALEVAAGRERGQVPTGPGAMPTSNLSPCSLLLTGRVCERLHILT